MIDVRQWISRALVTSLVLMGSGTAAPTLAKSIAHQRHAQAAEQRISKAQAAAAATSAYGGKVLKVEEINNGGRALYRVKLLQPDGRVRIVTVDGRSGRAN